MLSVFAQSSFLCKLWQRVRPRRCVWSTLVDYIYERLSVSHHDPFINLSVCFSLGVMGFILISWRLGLSSWAQDYILKMTKGRRKEKYVYIYVFIYLYFQIFFLVEYRIPSPPPKNHADETFRFGLTVQVLDLVLWGQRSVRAPKKKSRSSCNKNEFVITFQGNICIWHITNTFNEKPHEVRELRTIQTSGLKQRIYLNPKHNLLPNLAK